MEIYSTTNRNKFMPFVGKWIQLEFIIWNELGQMQTAKFTCFLSGLTLRKFKIYFSVIHNIVATVSPSTSPPSSSHLLFFSPIHLSSPPSTYLLPILLSSPAPTYLLPHPPIFSISLLKIEGFPGIWMKYGITRYSKTRHNPSYQD